MSNSIRLKMAIYAAGSFFILFSCTKEPTKIERTPTSTFPLTTDSRWEYEGIFFWVPYNDPALADTIRMVIYRHVIGPDTGLGIEGIQICDDSLISFEFDIPDTFIQRSWLKLEDNELRQFAYDDYSPGNEPDPHIYDPPHILLDFPLSGGKSWIAWQSESFIENRSVEGIDYIEMPLGWEYCDVTKSTLVHTPSNDTIYSRYEWYTDDGLMRSETDHGNQFLYDNSTILDSARTYEIWELVEKDIQP